jgi:hypothetical protein
VSEHRGTFERGPKELARVRGESLLFVEVARAQERVHPHALREREHSQQGIP